MRLYIKCPNCKGTGKKARWFWGTEDCTKCKGSGKVLEPAAPKKPQAPRITPPIGQKNTVLPVDRPVSAGKGGDFPAGVDFLIEDLSIDKKEPAVKPEPAANDE